MWYMKTDGSFTETDDTELIKIESMFQELQLWKGENPMNYEAGIDYQGVFENRVSLQKSIEDITSNYESSFQSITVGEPVTSSDGETASIDITIVCQDGSTLTRQLAILI